MKLVYLLECQYGTTQQREFAVGTADFSKSLLLSFPGKRADNFHSITLNLIGSVHSKLPGVYIMICPRQNALR